MRAALSEKPESITELMIRLMQRRDVGYSLTIAAAELIIEDCRFNDWLTHVAKVEKPPSLTKAELFDLADACEAIDTECAAIVNGFKEVDGIKAAIAANKAATTALIDLKARLIALRTP